MFKYLTPPNAFLEDPSCLQGKMTISKNGVPKKLLDPSLSTETNHSHIVAKKIY